jgi:hypothetical protein
MSPSLSRRQLMAMREERIMGFCIDHAHKVIGELQASGGDHSEDVEILEGLIETWEELAMYHRHDQEGRL